MSRVNARTGVVKTLGDVAGIVGFVDFGKGGKLLVSWGVILELAAFIGKGIERARCRRVSMCRDLVDRVQKEWHGSVRQVVRAVEVPGYWPILDVRFTSGGMGDLGQLIDDLTITYGCIAINAVFLLQVD